MTASFLPEPQPGPGPGPGPGADDPGAGEDSALSVDLSAKAKQRVLERGAVIVKASCPLEDCEVALGGGRKLRAVTEPLPAGAAERIKLRLKRKQLRKLAAALHQRRKPRLAVTAEATDRAGNATTDALTVRMRKS